VNETTANARARMVKVTKRSDRRERDDDEDGEGHVKGTARNAANVAN